MGRQIAKYVEVFRLNLQQQLTYRGEAAWRSLSMVVFMLIFASQTAGLSHGIRLSASPGGVPWRVSP